MSNAIIQKATTLLICTMASMGLVLGLFSFFASILYGSSPLLLVAACCFGSLIPIGYAIIRIAQSWDDF